MKFPTQQISSAYTHFMPVAPLQAQGQNIIKFGYIPQLQNRLITGIVTFSSVSAANWIDGEDIFLVTDAANSFLTLEDDTSYQFVKRTPYNWYNSLQFGQNIKTFGPPRVVNWEKSFLELTDTISTNALFTIFYIADK